MKTAFIATFAVAAAMVLSACASSQSGVKTNYHSQWTEVRADVKATTAAAERVLNNAELKDVKSSVTSVDGSASGKKSDGTKVTVAIERKGDSKSQVEVTVGKMGDPKLGADLARQIKEVAEMGSSSATTKP